MIDQRVSSMGAMPFSRSIVPGPVRAYVHTVLVECRILKAFEGRQGRMREDSAKLKPFRIRFGLSSVWEFDTRAARWSAYEEGES